MRTALVTGATGYVGSNLVEELLDRGWTVRTLNRDSDKLGDFPWGDLVEAVEGDATDDEAVGRALEGVDVAWYLLHSMGTGEDFAQQDREMATTFSSAAKKAGVQRIIYLGGLHPDGEELSDHLASRVEVGEILMESGVPTACLQAGVVLGDESISFQMLRHLSERLPGAIAPDWLNNSITPIAVDDVIHYLAGAADLPAHVNRTFDIGGPDTLTYGEMMQRYARAVGLGPRPVVTAPLTTPRAAALWVALVTPISYDMALPLIESVLHDTVVKEQDIHQYVEPPAGGAMGFDDAVCLASADVDTHRDANIRNAVLAALGVLVLLGAFLLRR